MPHLVKPPAKSARPKTELPPLPRLEGTYTQIIVNAIQSAQAERRFTRKVRSATREFAALVPHTRERWVRLSLLGRVVTVACLVGVGAGATYLVLRPLLAPNPVALRAELDALVEAQDFVAAKRKLDLLTSLEGGITPDERWHLVGAVQSGLNRLQGEWMGELKRALTAERWSEALAVLDKFDDAQMVPEWSLFTRADTLRKAGREQEAGALFARYVELYPSTERTDDALFWQAAARRSAGDTAATRALLEQLLHSHPQSNFKSSAKRWLTELDAPAPAP